MRAKDIIRLEWVIVGLIIPFLMFPTVIPRVTAMSLGVLVLWWGMRGIWRHEIWPVTPFNGVLLLFVLSILLSSIITPLPELSLPKITNLILGLAVFRVIAWHVHDNRSLLLAVGALLVLGLGMIGIGMLSVAWSSKLPFLRPWLQHLPHTSLRLPELSEQRGVNPNQLGGVLAFYTPLVIGLAGYKRQPQGILTSWGVRLCLWAIALFSSAILVLTQSRSGWAGGLAGIAVVVWYRWHTVRYSAWRRGLALALVLVLLGALVMYAPLMWSTMEGLVQDVLDDGIVASPWGRINVRDRTEIWTHCVYILQDFPLTGLGLGTFRRFIRVLYPFVYVPSAASLYHAHNVFLHVGTDLGFLGLIAYISLLLVGVWVIVRVGRINVEQQGVLYSIGAAFLGYHVYGMTDTLSLGSKPALLLWMALGLMAAISRMAYTRTYIEEET